jgi:hypothetical protein
MIHNIIFIYLIQINLLLRYLLFIIAKIKLRTMKFMKHNIQLLTTWIHLSLSTNKMKPNCTTTIHQINDTTTIQWIKSDDDFNKYRYIDFNDPLPPHDPKYSFYRVKDHYNFKNRIWMLKEWRILRDKKYWS